MLLSPSQPQEELRPKVKEVGILGLGAFAKLQKATVSCVFFWPSAQNLAATRQIFMKFNIWVFFVNLWIKIKFHYSLTRINGALHADLCTFVIVCR
jgi:hypothetical protein